MIRRFLRSAIRHATVTESDRTSLVVDPILLRAANVLPFEEVEIVQHATGERFTTFAEAGEEGSGEVRIHRVRAGDAISVLSWGLLHDGQTLNHWATIVTVDERNVVVAVAEAASGLAMNDER
jgi:aspartate 1-decarboxylase